MQEPLLEPLFALLPSGPVRRDAPRETDSEGAPPERQLGQLRFEDEEHVGFRPARLAEDPLETPGPQAYSRAFLQQPCWSRAATVRRPSAGDGHVLLDRRVPAVV